MDEAWCSKCKTRRTYFHKVIYTARHRQPILSTGLCFTWMSTSDVWCASNFGHSRHATCNHPFQRSAVLEQLAKNSRAVGARSGTTIESFPKWGGRHIIIVQNPEKANPEWNSYSVSEPSMKNDQNSKETITRALLWKQWTGHHRVHSDKEQHLSAWRMLLRMREYLRKNNKWNDW